MNITEFRQQYPQYEGVSDDDLSKAVHKKLYGHVPYETFAEKFIPKEDSYAGRVMEELPGALEGAGRMVAGVPGYIAGGITGLATAPFVGVEEALKKGQGVSEALNPDTYLPTGGRTDAFNEILGALNEKVGELGLAGGEAIGGDVGGLAGQIAAQTALQLAPIPGVKGLSKALRRPGEQRRLKADQDRQVAEDAQIKALEAARIASEQRKAEQATLPPAPPTEAFRKLLRKAERDLKSPDVPLPILKTLDQALKDSGIEATIRPRIEEVGKPKEISERADLQAKIDATEAELKRSLEEDQIPFEREPGTGIYDTIEKAQTLEDRAPTTIEPPYKRPSILSDIREGQLAPLDKPAFMRSAEDLIQGREVREPPLKIEKTPVHPLGGPGKKQGGAVGFTERRNITRRLDDLRNQLEEAKKPGPDGLVDYAKWQQLGDEYSALLKESQAEPKVTKPLGQLGAFRKQRGGPKDTRPSFEDWKREKLARGIGTNLPDEVLRGVYEGSTKPVTKVPEGLPTDRVQRVTEDIPGLEQVARAYVDDRPLAALESEIASAKDLKFIARNTVGKAIPSRFYAKDHPLGKWTVAQVFRIKSAYEKLTSGTLHGISKRKPSPGTFAYTDKIMSKAEKESLEHFRWAIDERTRDGKITRELSESELNDIALEVNGTPLTPAQLESFNIWNKGFSDRVNRVNTFLRAEGKDPIPVQPHYTTPNVFQGPWIVRFHDKTTGLPVDVQEFYLKPDIGKIRKNFPQYEVMKPEDISKRKGQATFDPDMITWLTRHLKNTEGRAEVSKAISESLRRMGIQSRALKRQMAKREGSEVSFEKGRELREKGIREMDEWLSRRELDKLYKELVDSDMLKKYPENTAGALDYSLDYVDTARGRMNKVFEAIDGAINWAITLGGEGRLPSSFARDAIRGLNKVGMWKLIGQFLPSQIGAQLLQHLFTIPAGQLIGRRAGAGSVKADVSVMRALAKSYAEMLRTTEGSRDIRDLRASGALESTFQFDYSTYSKDSIKAQRSNALSHASGLSFLTWLESEGVRKPAALTFLNLMKELGADKKYTREQMVEIAKGLTDDYMVSMKYYNKSQMFNRTGLGGQLLSPLQNFGMTWLAQFREFTRAAVKEGHVAPLATFLGINLMTAGIRGMIGFEEWDILARLANASGWFPFHIMTATEWLFSKKRDPKLNYGVVSDITGTYVGSTFAAPSFGRGLPGTQAPIAFQILGDMAQGAWSAFKDTGVLGADKKPTELEKRESLKGITPRVLWGMIEKHYSKPGLPEQQPGGSTSPYTRGKEDWAARMWGTYSIPEVESKLKYREAKIQQEIRSKKFREAIQKSVDRIMSGSSPMELEMIIRKLGPEQYMPREYKNALRDAIKRRMTEADLRQMGRGKSSQQRYLAQLYNRMSK